VGNPGSGNRVVAAVVTASAVEEVASYRNGAEWADGPQAVYDRLAVAALSRLPDRLDGVTAVDVGAGTGAATRELLRRGADVVAVDLSPSMLAELTRQTDGRVPTFVGDIRRLSTRDNTFDVAVAAFVLNHLDDPAAGVRELARVTRPGGHVLATTFGADDHPIKAAVDEVLMRYGFVHPEWYRVVKEQRIPLSATVGSLAASGSAGGLADLRVEDMRIDLSDLPTRDTVAYRLGLAHIAPFVATLDAATRMRLDAELADAIEGLPPLVLPMLVLSGRS
jgi:ubiquinone/menaquinone biosynthesis C-methylase UbiE